MYLELKNKKHYQTMVQNIRYKEIAIYKNPGPLKGNTFNHVYLNIHINSLSTFFSYFILAICNTSNIQTSSSNRLLQTTKKLKYFSHSGSVISTNIRGSKPLMKCNK